MNTFRNIFATVAMFLFVGLAFASSPAMADEFDENGVNPPDCSNMMRALWD